MAEYLTFHNSNTHGAFATSRQTDATINAARAAMADFLGCDANEVVFGPNMTTLTFAISRAFGREIRPGDEIVVTCLDHDANVAPWQALEERGAIIRMVDIDGEDCTLDMADMARAISPRTKLVAVGYASNAVGTINDVATITRMAHDVGALVYIDAVHYAPHGPIDVRALDCDFLACSPYKFFRTAYGSALRQARASGALASVQGASLHRCRFPTAGKPALKNHEGLAGITAAIDYLAELGQRVAPAATRRAALVQAMEAIQMYERGSFRRNLIASLLAIPELTFYGISDPARFAWRTPTVAVRMARRTPRELAERLGERGIFCWDGNYYAINLTERLGVEADGGMLRIGLVHYNTAEEIDRLLEALQEIRS